MPYKSRYTLGEFWTELTQASWYKKYAEANPAEAAAIQQIVDKKVTQQPYVIPIDLAKTHMGMALVMCLLTFSDT